MNIETSVGTDISSELLANYFKTLVNQVFKILPMRELSQDSLQKYIWRLEAELIGCRDLLPCIKEDSYFASLLNILSYLSEHAQSCGVAEVRQLVFEAIGICGKLRMRYVEDEHTIGGH